MIVTIPTFTRSSLLMFKPKKELSKTESLARETIKSAFRDASFPDVKSNFIQNLHVHNETSCVFRSNVKFLGNKKSFIIPALKEDNYENLDIDKPYLISLYKGNPESPKFIAFFDENLVLDITNNVVLNSLQEWLDTIGENSARLDSVISNKEQLIKLIEQFNK